MLSICSIFTIVLVLVGVIGGDYSKYCDDMLDLSALAVKRVGIVGDFC